MWEDPIVAEVRRVREEYARKFNYDLQAIYRDIKEQEKKSGRKIVSLAPKKMEMEPRSEPEANGPCGYTTMTIPTELVPAVRELLARHQQT